MNLSKQQKLDKNTLSAKRRAIIKGSVTTIPMVLTLRSGAAFAVQSASCLKPASDVSGVDPLVETADSWFRIQTVGRIIKIKGSDGSITTTIFLNPDPATFPDGVKADDPSGKWYPTDSNSMTGAVYTQVFESGSPKEENGALIMQQDSAEYEVISENDTCYVTVSLTAEGEFTSPFIAGALGSGDFLASNSCWSSIHG